MLDHLYSIAMTRVPDQWDIRKASFGSFSERFQLLMVGKAWQQERGVTVPIVLG